MNEMRNIVSLCSRCPRSESFMKISVNCVGGWAARQRARFFASFTKTQSSDGQTLIKNDLSNMKNIYDEESARRLVQSLSSDDRVLLLKELNREKSQKTIAEYTAALARRQWRRRWSGLSHDKTIDPSGLFCEIPASWEKESQPGAVAKPAVSKLIHYGVYSGVPFVGFGFLDNFIMITAGDYIELSMGAALGIGTMTAAALGNTISDVAGIGSSFYIETLATKFGVRPPDLDTAQLQLPACHWSANLGRTIGLVLGCILGMFPLLFLSTHASDTDSGGAQSEQQREEQGRGEQKLEQSAR